MQSTWLHGVNATMRMWFFSHSCLSTSDFTGFLPLCIICYCPLFPFGLIFQVKFDYLNVRMLSSVWILVAIQLNVVSFSFYQHNFVLVVSTPSVIGCSICSQFCLFPYSTLTMCTLMEDISLPIDVGLGCGWEDCIFQRWPQRYLPSHMCLTPRIVTSSRKVYVLSLVNVGGTWWVP